MSELFDKQVNAQKEKIKASGIHASSRKPMKQPSIRSSMNQYFKSQKCLL